MEWWLVLLLLVSSFLLLMFLGVPIAFSFGMVALVSTIFLWGKKGLFTFATLPFGVSSDFVLVTVPMFILVGELIVCSEVSQDLFDAASKWVGHLPGGLAITVQVIGTLFAGTSGSSPGDTAVVGSVSSRELLRHGYDPRLISGSIVAAGALATVIPPSTLMILLGFVGQLSIGRLFIAGVVPGIMLSLIYIAYIIVRCSIRPELGPPAERATWGERWASLWKVWPVLFLGLGMLGGLYAGLGTPTEIAGVGAFIALLIMLAKGQLYWRNLREALRRTVTITVFVLWTVMGGVFFGHVLTFTGAGQELVNFVVSLPAPPWVILIIINLVLIGMGAVMDEPPIIMVAAPILMPLAVKLGFDPLWFGMVFIMNMELGLICPPVGVNLFVLKGVAPEMETADIIRGAFPFLLLQLAGLILVMVFPQLALWLPSTMK